MSKHHWTSQKIITVRESIGGTELTRIVHYITKDRTMARSKRDEGRRGRFGSLSEKNYYEMKRRAEERANKKKATAKKAITPKPKSSTTAAQRKAALAKADRDNKRGLTKAQARDMGLTGDAKRVAGVKMSSSMPPKKRKRPAGVGTIKDKKTRPVQGRGVGTLNDKRTRPVQGRGVGTLDDKRIRPLQNERLQGKGVGTIDKKPATAKKSTSILKQPERLGEKTKSRGFLSRLFRRGNARRFSAGGRVNGSKGIDGIALRGKTRAARSR